MINIIAAVDENYLIGNGNSIPWNIPEDMALFKEKTLGNIVVMGRKTFESIGRPLPHRINIVVSRTPEKFSEKYKNIIWENSLENALSTAEKINKIFSEEFQKNLENLKIFKNSKDFLKKIFKNFDGFNKDSRDFYKNLKSFFDKNNRGNKEKEIFIIGGAEIYKEAFEKNFADRLCISHIKGKFKGDVFFPKKDFSNYKVVEKNIYSSFIYCEYLISR